MLFEFHSISLLGTSATIGIYMYIFCLGIPPLWTSDEYGHCLCFLQKDPGNTFSVSVCFRVRAGEKKTLIYYNIIYWLAASTHLKNISQNGNLPQVGMKIKNA